MQPRPVEAFRPWHRTCTARGVYNTGMQATRQPFQQGKPIDSPSFQRPIDLVARKLDRLNLLHPESLAMGLSSPRIADADALLSRSLGLRGSRLLRWCRILFGKVLHCALGRILGAIELLLLDGIACHLALLVGDDIVGCQ